MKKNNIIAIIAVIVAIIVIGSVIGLELPKLAPKPTPTYNLAVYGGPSGPNATTGSDHILGGCVLAVADTPGMSSGDRAAMEQFMAYMLSPEVQYDCMHATGFIPISSHDNTSYSVPLIYVAANASITIDYFSSISPSDYTAFTTGAISHFESKYPNIIVKPTDITATSIVNTVEANIQAGKTTPIVMTIDNLDIGILASGQSNGHSYLYNMAGMVSTVMPKTGVIPSITSLTTTEEPALFNGAVPFITQVMNTPLVWINNSTLQSAGITSLPATYSQMLSDAKILDKKYGRGMINIQGHGGASTATELYQMLVQFGGNPVTLNSTGDINGMYCLYNMSKYFSPEYKTSYWATYKGLASEKYAVMDYQWPGSVNFTALDMKYNDTGVNSVTNISISALHSGVFIRDPVIWISEWQTIMDKAYVTIIESGTTQNYASIQATLNGANSAMFNYLEDTYNYTTAQNFENGMYKPIAV